MCFEYIYKNFIINKTPNIPLTTPLTIIETCGLCNQSYEIIKLDCNHIICKGCLETQRLYSYEPCFLCKNITWVTFFSPFSNENVKISSKLD